MFINQRWRFLNWQRAKVSRRLKGLVYSRIYRNPSQDLNKSILIAGTARSGTTWLADILSAALPGRIMFEPFNPHLVQDYSRFHYMQYMRPEEQDRSLEKYCHQVFSGSIRHPWIDHQVMYLNAQYRIIKAIRASLLIKWIRLKFPVVPLIYVIRHPCAVVLSWLQLGWDGERDVESFLAQPKLLDDFLSPFRDVINQATTIEERIAVTWCVTNLIPLRQFCNSELHVFFYEHLCTQPELEAHRLYVALEKPYDERALNSFSRPSTTSQSYSAVVKGSDPIGGWRRKLDSQQIQRILSVVASFGLDHIYGDSLIPLPTPDKVHSSE